LIRPSAGRALRVQPTLSRRLRGRTGTLLRAEVDLATVTRVGTGRPKIAAIGHAAGGRSKILSRGVSSRGADRASLSG